MLSARVKTALARDELGSLLDIEVESFRGVVPLSGLVVDETRKARAGEVASGVEGVARIENTLVVKPLS